MFSRQSTGEVTQTIIGGHAKIAHILARTFAQFFEKAYTRTLGTMCNNVSCAKKLKQ